MPVQCQKSRLWFLAPQWYWVVNSELQVVDLAERVSVEDVVGACLPDSINPFAMQQPHCEFESSTSEYACID